MKLTLKSRLASPLLLTIVVMGLMTNAWGGVGPFQLKDKIEHEIAERKIAAENVDQQSKDSLRKSVDEKQLKAIQLINAVGTYANDRFASDLEKDEAANAYGGFIARFQGIYEEREALSRKEIAADSKTLQNYSQNYDALIADIQKFIK